MDKIELRLEQYQVEQMIKSLVKDKQYVVACIVIRQYLGLSIMDAIEYYRSLPEYEREVKNK